MSSFRGMFSKNAILLTIILALNFTQVFSEIPMLSEIFNEVSDRSLVERNNVSEASTDLGDTVRVDPLDNLNKYRGGYNITNKNYWSSTTFTGVYGIAIALVWLLCGLGYGMFALVRATCCKKRSHSRNERSTLLLILAVFFTVLAVAACGMCLGGNKMFYSRSQKVVRVVSNTAKEATDSIYLISGAFKHINSSLLQVGTTPRRATEFIKSTVQELDSRGAELKTQASQITQLINEGLHIVYLVITIIVSLILVFVISLLAFGVLKFRKVVHLLVAICWILGIFSWIFFGVYLFFHNLTGDTCVALKGFNQNPYNNSLSTLLPCDKLLPIHSVLQNVGKGIHESVDKVNQNISTSYGDIIQLCNPFSAPPMYDYRPWDCPESSTRIGDIPKVLRQVACPDDEVKTCSGGIMIRGNYFRMVDAYSVALQKLLDVFPNMESIAKCQIIKDAFSEILDKHCKPLKRSLHMIWGSFVFLSTVLALLLIVWIAGADRRQSQHYSAASTT